MVEVIFRPPAFTASAVTAVLRLNYNRENMWFWLRVAECVAPCDWEAWRDAEIKAILDRLEWRDLRELGVGEEVVIASGMGETRAKRLGDDTDTFLLRRISAQGREIARHSWRVGQPFTWGWTAEKMASAFDERYWEMRRSECCHPALDCSDLSHLSAQGERALRRE